MPQQLLFAALVAVAAMVGVYSMRHTSPIRSQNAHLLHGPARKAPTISYLEQPAPASTDTYSALLAKLESRARREVAEVSTSTSTITTTTTASPPSEAVLAFAPPAQTMKFVSVANAADGPTSLPMARGVGGFDAAINEFVGLGLAVAAVAGYFIKKNKDETLQREAEELRQRELEIATRVAAEKAEARRKQEDLVRSRALEEEALKLKREKEAQLKAEAERRAEEEQRRAKKAREDEMRRVAAEKEAEAARKRALQEAALKLKAQEEAAAAAAAKAAAEQRERERQERAERTAAEEKARLAAKAAEEVRLANAKKAQEAAAAEAQRVALAQAEERARSARLLDEARRAEAAAQQAAQAALDDARVSAVKKQVAGLASSLSALAKADAEKQAVASEARLTATKAQAQRLVAALQQGEVDARVSAVKAQASRLASAAAAASAHSASAAPAAATAKAAAPAAQTSAATAPAAVPGARVSARTSDLSTMDAIQASAEKAYPGDSPEALAKRFDEVVTLLAKVPVARLRQLVSTHSADLLPPASAAGTSLDAAVQAGVGALWAATGEFSAMAALAHAELDWAAAEATQWMRASVTAANELSESRLKDLIKSKGGGRVVIPKPKGMRGAAAAAAEVDGPKKSLLTKSDCESDCFCLFPHFSVSPSLSPRPILTPSPLPLSHTPHSPSPQTWRCWWTCCARTRATTTAAWRACCRPSCRRRARRRASPRRSERETE